MNMVPRKPESPISGMAAQPRYPKSRCCVPGCRRSSTLFSREWMCGDHWRLVDRALKAFRTKRMRPLYRRWSTANALRVAFQQDALSRGEEVGDGVWRLVDIERRAARRWWAAENLIWRKMKRQAIERAAGLA